VDELAALARQEPRPTVAVAMSGGVDSSVAAALCVQAGLPVVGIMLRLWAESGAAGANKCCTLGAVDDARAVADRLGIPFSVLDAADRFKDLVVDPFLDRAASGDTPNPCFGCNRRMRFGFLLGQAQALGADYLATGHYARRRAAPGGGWALERARDAEKDQSYMLHRLDQARLAHALFPVGGFTKAEVRALARGFELPVAERPDSVDLCWVAEDGVGGFLGRSLPPAELAPGPILDAAGRRLGTHRGLPRYTVGQRRGLGVAAGVPLYVLGKDSAANALLVGPAEALAVERVVAEDWHWIAGQAPGPDEALSAQVRYRAPAVPGRLALGADGRGTLTFERPVRAPAPGQGLVLYRGERCLGGGRIVTVDALPGRSAA
jgi:tRNA-specific 2-thiouridylase